MSGTVKTIPGLLAGVPSGGVSGGIIPANIQDIVATMAAMSGFGVTLPTAAAAGSIQSDATQLTTFATSITPVGVGQGVRLMTFANAPLVVQKVINDGVNILAVYPPFSVSIGATGARVPNQAVLVPVGATVSVAMTSPTTGELVAVIGDPTYVPQRMGVTGGYRNINPPWVRRLINNADLVDRSAALPTLAWSAVSSPPLGVAKPAYLGSVLDPYYGTVIQRISGDPGTAMLNIASGVWGRVVRHHYSSDQAWNCDETMLMISNNSDTGGNAVTLTRVTNGTTAAGNAILHFAAWVAGNVPGSSGIYVGAGVTGTNIPGGTTIISFDATAGTATMSANATSTGVASAATITFTDLGTNLQIFLDGQTYVPLFAHSPPNGDPRWHPTKPDTMIYADLASPSKLFTYVPATDTSTLVTNFGNAYNAVQLGGGHGCVGWPPGQEALPIVPFIATRISDGHVVGFSYDFSTATKSPDVDVSAQAGATGPWVGADVSVSGQYLICLDTNDIIFVYTRSTGALFSGPFGSGTSGKPSHYDVSIDAAGADVLVGVNKLGPSVFGQVVKLNLTTGAYTFLTPASPLNFAVHSSQQAYAFPAWGISSYYSRFETGSNPLYIGEIIAYPLDAGMNPVRLCHHFNTNNPANYYNETQASISPSGTRIIFHSNWGNPNNDGRPQQLYVCDLRSQTVNFAG